MSVAQPGRADTRPSGLAINLSSNNPFRNRTASPTYPAATQYSPSEAPPRPVSRNPFLDTSSSANTNSFPIQHSQIPSPAMGFPAAANAMPSPALTGNAADLFNELSLEDKPSASSSQRRQLPSRSQSNTGNSGVMGPPPYSRTTSENVPPRQSNGHRPSRSQEQALRARNAADRPEKSKPSASLDIFADPPVEGSRRQRRSSDAPDRDSKPLSPEEEKKKAERRERRKRHEAARLLAAKKKLDVIDKLDATSIYGTGLFHHDGPFDACNPHRNKKNSRQPAPMSAFAKDSANTTMGGGGPLNKRPDHATFLGNNDEEAFKDYSKGAAGDPYGNGAYRPGGLLKSAIGVESPTTRIEPVHGDESLGLGTSTFLEGAPASRTAMQRRQSEQEKISPIEGGAAGGLSRKKSLAQKIRSGYGSRREGPSGRMNNPDLPSPQDAYTPGGTRNNETDPFFNEFSKGDDGAAKKDANVAISESLDSPRKPSPPSPRQRGPIPRRTTGDVYDTSRPPPVSQNNTGGGGFLSRVKSLRKPRAEKPLPSQSQEN